MKKYYDIKKLSSDKLYHFIPQRRNNGIIIELKRRKRKKGTLKNDTNN